MYLLLDRYSVRSVCEKRYNYIVYKICNNLLIFVCFLFLLIQLDVFVSIYFNVIFV